MPDNNSSDLIYARTYSHVTELSFTSWKRAALYKIHHHTVMYMYGAHIVVQFLYTCTWQILQFSVANIDECIHVCARLWRSMSSSSSSERFDITPSLSYNAGSHSIQWFLEMCRNYNSARSRADVTPRAGHVRVTCVLCLSTEYVVYIKAFRGKISSCC